MRNPRQHRAEERRPVDVNGGRADVIADRVHPGVVTLTQRFVVGVTGSRVGQLRRQIQLLERLLDDVVEVLVALVVNPGAHRLVQRRQDFRAVGLLSGNRHPHRAERLGQPLLVFRGQVLAVLVEHREAHHLKVHLDVAYLLHFQDPARSDPRPRAQRVEPEIGD